MKKIIIAISGLLLVVCIVIKVVDAQSNPQDTKKASTETKMDCKKGPAVSCCSKMADSKTAGDKACDPAKCKDAKCDTTKGKACCANMKTGMKNCDPARCTTMMTKK
jgi:hypothetical protein